MSARAVSSRALRFCALALVAAAPAAAQEPTAPDASCEIELRLDPERAALQAAATLRLRDPGPDEPTLELGAAFRVERAEIDGAAVPFDDRLEEGRRRVRPAHPRLDGPHEIRLEYAGPLPAAAPGQSPVRLDAGAGWYPELPGLAGAVAYRLTVELPPGWQAVAEGPEELREETGRGVRVRYRSPRPGAARLLAGRWSRHERRAGEAEVAVYLPPEQGGRAPAMLAAAAERLTLAVGRFGPYPPGTLSVVEALLPGLHAPYGIAVLPPGSDPAASPELLRMLEHDVLHGWWGGGVEPDPHEGDWSEGLVAYLVSHGPAGAEGLEATFRREALARYTRRLARPAGAEAPLGDRAARPGTRDPVLTHARAAMVFHMLRRRLGREGFDEALRELVRARRGGTASWSDWRAAFSAAAGEDLGWFFAQWVDRAGAPRLSLSDVRLITPPREDRDDPAAGPGARFAIHGTIRQEGGGRRVRVPVGVETGSAVLRRTVELEGPETSFRIEVPAVPEVLQLDPDHDVLRLLDPIELEPADSEDEGPLVHRFR